MTIVKCKFCGGRGKVGDMFIGYGSCPTCGGAGELNIDIPEDQLVKCGLCEGSGKEGDIFVGYNPCTACKGIGLIQRPSGLKPSIGLKPSMRKKVFVVHGRDKTPALELARLIDKRYPIEAILLEEEAHRGRTLIEKLEDYSGVDFAFITLTPDDVGALKGEPLEERGRQNVIFELGQFIGKIGRKNICLLIKGQIEIPSDLNGVGYYRFNKSVKECFLEVENELKDAKLV